MFSRSVQFTRFPSSFLSHHWAFSREERPPHSLTAMKVAHLITPNGANTTILTVTTCQPIIG